MLGKASFGKGVAMTSQLASNISFTLLVLAAILLFVTMKLIMIDHHLAFAIIRNKKVWHLSDGCPNKGTIGGPGGEFVGHVLNIMGIFASRLQIRPILAFPLEANDASDQFDLARFLVNGKECHDNVLDLVFNEICICFLSRVPQCLLQTRRRIILQLEINATPNVGWMRSLHEVVAPCPHGGITFVSKGMKLDETFAFLVWLKVMKFITYLSRKSKEELKVFGLPINVRAELVREGRASLACTCSREVHGVEQISNVVEIIGVGFQLGLQLLGYNLGGIVSPESFLTGISNSTAKLGRHRGIETIPPIPHHGSEGLAGLFQAADGYQVALREDRVKRIPER